MLTDGSAIISGHTLSPDFPCLLKCPLSSSLTSAGTQSGGEGGGRGGGAAAPGLRFIIRPMTPRLKTESMRRCEITTPALISPSCPVQPVWERSVFNECQRTAFFQIGPYKYFSGLMTRERLRSERSRWVIHLHQEEENKQLLCCSCRCSLIGPCDGSDRPDGWSLRPERGPDHQAACRAWAPSLSLEAFRLRLHHLHHHISDTMNLSL